MDLTDFLIRLALSAIAVFVTSKLLSGVKVSSFGQSILVAILLGIVNAVVKPILVFLTIPLTLITLGLFLLVINALMIMLVDKLLKGFAVKSFWWALLFSIILSIINGFLQWVY
ncbi:phage holin family protein [Marivirga sp. S37H4]|uniref:Phage holin family protein n=1 Tax=Marivirga aurantiaca TaxID=2802615 RepID=A0A935C6J0_9BACT|nr:phage holin family protein [Marivirga aurantiaca]MBK6264399.1 phage holin family protein [Marivirga aurantiaca]